MKLAPRRYRLVDLLAGMDSDKRQAEAEWGRAAGNEVW